MPEKSTSERLVEATLDQVVQIQRVADALEVLALAAGKIVDALTSKPAPASRPAANAGATFPNYGKSKGAPIAGASLQDLEYYANGCRRTLADPAKDRWHDKERETLAAIESEIARQDGKSGGDFGPPPPDVRSGPPTEDDIPF